MTVIASRGAPADAHLCGGCLVGAGAGGAIYFSGNGVESILTTSMDDALEASERALQHFGVTRTEFQLSADPNDS